MSGGGSTFYVDSRDRRSVVLFDDRYVRRGHPQEEPDRVSQGIVDDVANALVARGMIVLSRDVLTSTRGLMVMPDGKWHEAFPAPSAWIVDIEIPLGGAAFGDVCDGVELAGHIRDLGICVPGARGEQPIPILFLSRFDIRRPAPVEGFPATDEPLVKRIDARVRYGWLYFRKVQDRDGNPVVQQWAADGEAVKLLDVDAFAEVVRGQVF